MCVGGGICTDMSTCTVYIGSLAFLNNSLEEYLAVM